jgi:hypothetical protein
MEIWVEFQDGKWRTSPDPAKVKLGAPIAWRFRADQLAVGRAKWSVHFDKSPFTAAGGSFTLSTSTTQDENGQHAGTSPIIDARKPGDYKYSLLAQDADTEETLGSEDPRLIVV